MTSWRLLPRCSQAPCLVHFFFGGLWWTVQKGVASESPAIWFVGSLLLRTGVVVAGFYLVAGHWSRLVACLFGFLIARVIVVNRLRRTPAEELTPLEKENSIALAPMNWFSGGTAFSCSIARSSRPGF